MSWIDEVSDQDLDRYIMTRLDMLGVDMSVLPDDDEDAPADRTRILASARRFLRSTPPVIHGFEMDVQDVPPEGYPAELRGRTEGR